MTKYVPVGGQICSQGDDSTTLRQLSVMKKHMAKRMIDTSIWESKQFCSLTDKEKLLYIGLITFANDVGCFQADCEMVKSHIFPRESIGSKRIQKMIEHVIEVGLIMLYEEKNEKFGFHPNWGKYQKIRPERRKLSSIPLPPTAKSQPSVSQLTTQYKIRQEKIIEPNIRHDKHMELIQEGYEKPSMKTA